MIHTYLETDPKKRKHLNIVHPVSCLPANATNFDSQPRVYQVPLSDVSLALQPVPPIFQTRLSLEEFSALWSCLKEGGKVGEINQFLEYGFNIATDLNPLCSSISIHHRSKMVNEQATYEFTITHNYEECFTKYRTICLCVHRHFLYCKLILSGMFFTVIHFYSVILYNRHVFYVPIPKQHFKNNRLTYKCIWMKKKLKMNAMTHRFFMPWLNVPPRLANFRYTTDVPLCMVIVNTLTVLPFSKPSHGG